MPPSGEVRMVLRTTSKPQTENDMTTDKKVARRKLSLLELANDLGNVSEAVTAGSNSIRSGATFRSMAPMGCSTASRRQGSAPQPGRCGDRDGDSRSCPGPPLPRPDAGCPGADAARHPGLLGRRARGLAALLTKHDRLLRPEKATADRKLTLSEEQIKLLERFSPEYRERHRHDDDPLACWPLCRKAIYLLSIAIFALGFMPSGVPRPGTLQHRARQAQMTYPLHSSVDEKRGSGHNDGCGLEELNAAVERFEQRYSVSGKTREGT